MIGVSSIVICRCTSGCESNYLSDSDYGAWESFSSMSIAFPKLYFSSDISSEKLCLMSCLSLRKVCFNSYRSLLKLCMSSCLSALKFCLRDCNSPLRFYISSLRLWFSSSTSLVAEVARLKPLKPCSSYYWSFLIIANFLFSFRTGSWPNSSSFCWKSYFNWSWCQMCRSV